MCKLALFFLEEMHFQRASCFVLKQLPVSQYRGKGMYICLFIFIDSNYYYSAFQRCGRPMEYVLLGVSVSS